MRACAGTGAKTSSERNKPCQCCIQDLNQITLSEESQQGRSALEEFSQRLCLSLTSRRSVTRAGRVTLHNMADSNYGGYTRFELELEVSLQLQVAIIYT